MKSLRQKLVFSILLITSLKAFAGSGSTDLGKQVSPPVSPPNPWEITGAAGLNLARGNSDNLQLNAEVLASYITLSDEVYLDASYLYGEDRGAVNNNVFRAYANYNHLLNECFYYGLFSDFLHDELANVDYRVDVGPNLGYYLIKNDTTKLAIEAGAGYLWEKVDVKDDYFTLRFAQRFEHKLSNRIKFVESVIYQPRADDFGDYLLTAEAGISFAISKHWAIKASVRDIYDSTPAAGAKGNDLAVLASLAYSLGGFADEAPAARRTLKPEKKKAADPTMGWTTTAFLGFGLTRGNSETLNLAGDLATVFRSPPNEFFFSAGGAYGETGDETNLQNFHTSAQYNRLLTERFYVGGSLAFLYDRLADLDYNVSPAVLAGVYLVKNDDVKFSVDAGPAYVWKKVGGVRDDYFALQFGERLSLKLLDNLSFGQSLAYVPDASDFNTYTIHAAAFVDVDVTSNLSFRAGVTDIYDSSPAAHSRKNDFTLTSGIAIKF